MLKTVRCSSFMTRMNKNFDATVLQTFWKPETTRLYNALELPSPSPVPHLMAQHFHPEISSSTLWARRQNQTQGRPRSELWFLFRLVRGAHATDVASPHTSPLSQGSHLSCPKKSGFNRAGDVGRIPIFCCCSFVS